MAELYILAADGRELELWCPTDETWRDAAINTDPNNSISRSIKYRVKPLTYGEYVATSLNNTREDGTQITYETFEVVFNKGIEYQKSLNNQSEAPTEGVEEVIKVKAIQSPSEYFGDPQKRFHRYNALVMFNGDNCGHYEDARQDGAVYRTSGYIDDLAINMRSEHSMQYIGEDVTAIIDLVTDCIGGNSNLIYGILDKQGAFVQLPLTIKE